MLPKRFAPARPKAVAPAVAPAIAAPPNIFSRIFLGDHSPVPSPLRPIISLIHLGAFLAKINNPITINILANPLEVPKLSKIVDSFIVEISSNIKAKIASLIYNDK